jgi:hypothetical protein
MTLATGTNNSQIDVSYPHDLRMKNVAAQKTSATLSIVPE